MTSDRMIQAIGRIDRAISRLEGAAARIVEAGQHQAREVESLRAERQQLVEAAERTAPAPAAAEGVDREKALSALRALDALIGELERARQNG